MKNLKIYLTSDLHGYIYPTDYIDKNPKSIGLLNIINQFEKDENTLVIDAGDTIQGSPFTNYLSNTDFNVHPISSVMNEGKYDYITLGNHDFNYGYDYLKKYLSNLNAKCLCSNVNDKLDELGILPYDIKLMGNGLKVGVIGVTTDFINIWERKENLVNFDITNAFDAIKKYHDEIKDKVDILIGIYHGGFEYNLNNKKKLSNTNENIAYKICNELCFDILLTGHQHMEIFGQNLHGTHIVQPPHNGSKFIEINLNYDGNSIKDINSSLESVKLNPNKKMYEKYLSLEEDIQKWLDTPVGFLDNALQPTSHLEMALNGSNLANFINQIQLDISNADISCTSFANAIKGFDKDVTIRTILSTYPYPNTLSVLEVSKKELKLALERCASYFTVDKGNISISDLFLKPKVEHYNYDYFANINYTFDLNKEVGNRVVSIIHNNKEINENDKFNLVMNNYRSSGAGGYDFYSNCKIIKEILVEMPDIIIDYFRKNKKVVVDKAKYINIIK